MMGYGYGYGFGMLWMMVIFLVLVSLIAVSLLRVANTNVRRHHDYRDDNSLDILDERFARGEIGEDEYNRKRQLLNKR